MNQDTQQNSKREWFLLMLFPTAIILALYSLLFALPLQQENVDIEAEYARQKAAAVSNQVAQKSLESLNNEKAALVRLRKRTQTSKQQIRQLSQSWRNRHSRLETLETITEFMRDNNLSIVSQGKDEGLAVSRYQQELFKMMNRQFPQNPVEYWNVKVKGAYFGVADFLEAVDGLEKAFIPVAITMKSESEDDSAKTWTIVFAI